MFFSKPVWAEDGGGKEEVDGDEDGLLDGEVPPGEELPQAFSLNLKNLDVDPFLRLQVIYLSTIQGKCMYVHTLYNVYIYSMYYIM